MEDEEVATGQEQAGTEVRETPRSSHTFVPEPDTVYNAAKWAAMGGVFLLAVYALLALALGAVSSGTTKDDPIGLGGYDDGDTWCPRREPVLSTEYKGPFALTFSTFDFLTVLKTVYRSAQPDGPQVRNDSYVWLAERLQTDLCADGRVYFNRHCAFWTTVLEGNATELRAVAELSSSSVLLLRFLVTTHFQLVLASFNEVLRVPELFPVLEGCLNLLQKVASTAAKYCTSKVCRDFRIGGGLEFLDLITSLKTMKLGGDLRRYVPHEVGENLYVFPDSLWSTALLEGTYQDALFKALFQGEFDPTWRASLHSNMTDFRAAEMDRMRVLGLVDLRHKSKYPHVFSGSPSDLYLAVRVAIFCRESLSRP